MIRQLQAQKDSDSKKEVVVRVTFDFDISYDIISYEVVCFDSGFQRCKCNFFSRLP